MLDGSCQIGLSFLQGTFGLWVHQLLLEGLPLESPEEQEHTPVDVCDEVCELWTFTLRVLNCRVSCCGSWYDECPDVLRMGETRCSAVSLCIGDEGSMVLLVGISQCLLLRLDLCDGGSGIHL